MLGSVAGVGVGGGWGLEWPERDVHDVSTMVDNQ